MERGTTPTHIFKVPLDASLIKEIKITYTQNDEEILVKRTEHCIVESGKITTKLSQEDTFLFDCTKFVYIQIRILTHGGDCLKSKMMMETVGKCLDEEVLV